MLNTFTRKPLGKFDQHLGFGRASDHTASMTDKLAEQGWMVRHTLMEAASKPAIRFFACGFDTDKEAESAVRRYPGVEDEDQVEAVHRLSAAELTSLKLKAGEIKAYG